MYNINYSRLWRRKTFKRIDRIKEREKTNIRATTGKPRVFSQTLSPCPPAHRGEISPLLNHIIQ